MKKQKKTRRGIVQRPVAKKNTSKATKSAPNQRKKTTKKKQLRVAKIDSAIKQYEKAARFANDRAEQIGKIAHIIGESAVEKFRVAILKEWADRDFLRDIFSLKKLFEEQPLANGSIPLDTFRLLPSAIIDWLESQFNLEVVGDVGKTIDIPAHRLSNYSFDFEPPANPNDLVSVKIIAPGWRRNGVLLLPPSVEMAQEEQTHNATSHGGGN